MDPERESTMAGTVQQLMAGAGSREITGPAANVKQAREQEVRKNCELSKPASNGSFLQQDGTF